jgi:hypothetical protein
MECLKLISEIFYNTALGVAALLMGYGALGVIRDYREKQHLSKKINSLKRMYRRDKMGRERDFVLMSKPNYPGVIYLIDLKKEKKYWIQSEATLSDMGMNMTDAENPDEILYEKFSDGEPIFTRE